MNARWLNRVFLFCLAVGLLSGCETTQRFSRQRTEHALISDQGVGHSATASEIAAPPAPEEPTQELELVSGNSLEPRPMPPVPEEGAGSEAKEGMTLAQFEQLAIAHNPAIAQASASAYKAAGFREQVGKYPNPTFGYNGTQLADRSTDQHTAFVEQTVVLGDKLELNELVLNQDVQSQLWEVEAQRYRVLTDVRQKFYEALAAQRRRELAAEFQTVAEEGVRITKIRREALDASLPEVLQAEIQLTEMNLILQKADFAYRAAWNELIAVAGVPAMTPVPLSGDLRVNPDPRDWDVTYEQMAALSPQLRAATARVARAQVNLQRQKVQPIPNVNFLLGAGYDQGTGSQLINVQAGLPLPIYNQNQGNISAAYAEFCRAGQEVRRLELSLKSQLARAAQQYDSAAVTVTQYETQILPKAQQTLQLSEQAYAVGEFNFLQVLIARRTFFDSNLQYVEALNELAQSQWLIEGMLLTGGLQETPDTPLDDTLREQSFSQQ